MKKVKSWLGWIFVKIPCYGFLACLFSLPSIFLWTWKEDRDLETVGPYHLSGFPVWFKSGAEGGSIAADFIPSRLLLNTLIWLVFLLLVRWFSKRKMGGKAFLIRSGCGMLVLAALSIGGNLLMPKHSGPECFLACKLFARLGSYYAQETLGGIYWREDRPQAEFWYKKAAETAYRRGWDRRSIDFPVKEYYIKLSGDMHHEGAPETNFYMWVSYLWLQGEQSNVLAIAEARLQDNANDIAGLILKTECDFAFSHWGSYSNSATHMLEVGKTIQTPDFVGRYLRYQSIVEETLKQMNQRDTFPYAERCIEALSDNGYTERKLK
jgi:hypothetical protein